jgi:hypothetical protein
MAADWWGWLVFCKVVRVGGQHQPGGSWVVAVGRYGVTTRAAAPKGAGMPRYGLKYISIYI